MRNWLIILMVILVFSCSKNKTPKGILTDKEITPVLIDLHLAEAIYTQRYALEITRENYQEDLYITILKKYKLDQKVFEASVLYYGKHPDKYKPIYDEVLNRLNEMNVRARMKDSIESRNPVVNDTANDTTAVKDTLTVKDTVQIKKTTEAKSEDQIKTLDINTKAIKAIRTQKTGIKDRPKDTVTVLK